MARISFRSFVFFSIIDEYLRENPNIARSEMAQLLGKSQNTIKYHPAALKSENLVERIGSDREGYWRVK